MLSVVKKVTIVACMALFLAMTAAPANNAEQLVFSTSGSFMTLSNNKYCPQHAVRFLDLVRVPPLVI